MQPPTNPSLLGYRWSLFAATILGFQVAVWAGFDVRAALNHDAPPPMVGSEAVVPDSGLTPVAQRQVWLAIFSGYRSALEGMLPWRVATSAALAVCAGGVFLLAMGLRLAQQGRAPLARKLGAAAIATAVLRSIDGGQNLVLARTSAAEAGKSLIREGMANAEEAARLLSTTAWLTSGAWTLLVVGAFVTLGNYFRSQVLATNLQRAEP